MSCRKLYLIITTLFFVSLESYSQTWNLRKDEQDVKIYTRGIEGSNIQEFKGEVTVKSNMAGILTLIDSVSAYPQWMKNCIYSERLKKVDASSGYTYYAMDAPWPVSDRDACTYYSVKQDTVTKIVTVSMKAVKNYLPEKPDRVRIPVLNGSWLLKPVKKGVTKIVYQVHCDIGGFVPALIVNAYITDTPFYNLVSLKRIVESPSYPKTVRSDVIELQ